MDLTAAIISKIERLRSAKTARYNALSASIEREVALLTHRSAALFTKLEDALEVNVLGNTTNPEELRKMKEEEGDRERIVDEDNDGEDQVITDESSIKEKQSENAIEQYDIDEEKGEYYDHESDVPVATSVITDPVSIKPSHDLVSDLRSRAQETQRLLVEKHSSLAQLRQKHDLAMKRLDKLQFDLEKVSKKWEAEERQRIQSESTSALGKRKRDEEDNGEGSAYRNWRRWGQRGVEWGVIFGIGVASAAVGMSKFQH
jgi:hypothetical protein